jgi:hypothetical protein
MKQMFFALSFGFVGLAFTISQARGQEGAVCLPRAEAVAKLTDRFGERRRAVGLVGEQAVMELYVSDASGTWTVLATLPDGQACLIASGGDFQMVNEPATVPGAPA